jgi:hypothetical protein
MCFCDRQHLDLQHGTMPVAHVRHELGCRGGDLTGVGHGV